MSVTMKHAFPQALADGQCQSGNRKTLSAKTSTLIQRLVQNLPTMQMPAWIQAQTITAADPLPDGHPGRSVATSTEKKYPKTSCP
jgi:hypothetical protein